MEEAGGAAHAHARGGVPRGTFGLAPPGSCGRRGQGAGAGGGSESFGGAHAACGSGVFPAAMAGSQATRRVTTTWIQRSSAAAHAVRACWRASRLSGRGVRRADLAPITPLFRIAPPPPPHPPTPPPPPPPPPIHFLPPYPPQTLFPP